MHVEKYLYYVTKPFTIVTYLYGVLPSTPKKEQDTRTQWNSITEETLKNQNNFWYLGLTIGYKYVTL